MIFFFKKPKIYVDCFTHHDNVFNNYKPLPSNKFIPQEWKALPKQVDVPAFGDNPGKMMIPNGTLKTCSGFLELFSTGFMLQMWADLYIETDSNGGFKAGSPSNVMQCEQHPKFQVWDTFYKEHSHVKIVPPWVLSEKSGVNFFWSGIPWLDTDMSSQYKPLTGVVNYKYQHATSINFFAPKDSLVKFRAGQPMVQIVPLSEKDVKLNYHLISRDEYANRFCHQPTYIRMQSEYKRLSKFNEKKCPFGFGK